MWHRLASRLTYANVVASLALFISLGGVSYGVASGAIGTREIKNNSIRSKDVRNRSLLNKDFKRGQLLAGAPGPQGDPGQPGAAGKSGAPGSPAASMIIGSSDVPLATTANCFCNIFPPSGFLPNGTVVSTDEMMTTTPNVPLVLRDFHVEIGASPGGGGSRIFDLITPSLQVLLSCTISGANFKCDSPGPVSIPGGTELGIRSHTGAVAPAATNRTRWAFRATAQ